MIVSVDEWKIPPIVKVYEAYSAVADGRVDIGDGRACVRSSDGSKEYTVCWESNIYSSNDNASYWRGYLGYPVIAVLMLQDKLYCDSNIVKWFAGIQWKSLNDLHKRDYDAAVAEAVDIMESRGANGDELERAVNKTYECLGRLEIGRKRGPNRPPKSY